MNDWIARLIARLNAKTQSYAVSDGGIVELTQTDIAASESNTPSEIGRLVFNAKYRNDERSKIGLKLVIAVLAEERFQGVKDERLAKISSVLLSDMMFNGKHDVCNGTGVYQGKTCPGCDKGNVGWSDFYIASNIGIDIRTFRNSYKAKYNKLVEYMQMQEAAHVAHVRNKLD